MNRYWDLTEQQRAELTDIQVEAMLTVELMEKGVVKVEPPVLEPVDGLVLEKETFYQPCYTGTYSSQPFGPLFRTYEAAQAFIDLNPLWSDYDYSIGQEYTTARAGGAMSITTVKLCREQDVVNVKARLSKIAATKKANEAAKSAYAEACRKVEQATSGVWDDWRECRAKNRDCQRIVDTLKEYVATCDGNERIARTFLAKAYSEDEIRTAMEWFGLNHEAAEEMASV